MIYIRIFTFFSNRMKKLLKIVLVSLCCVLGFSQEPEENTTKKVDSLYREDQFYAGLSYLNLQKNPQGLTQDNLSFGVNFGFLRDFPLNKNRNRAVAIGAGYCYNQYNFNMYSKPIGNEIYFGIIPEGSYDKSRLVQHFIEVPLEYRWRTSTFDSHKFWRIYTGIKASYMIYDHYKYTDSFESYSLKGNPNFNKLQYGAYVSGGWNSWNVYFYYGFSSLYKSGTIDDKRIKSNLVQIGLMFYIL